MTPHHWKRAPADNGAADPNADVRPNRPGNTVLGSIRGLMATAAAARDDAIGELVASLGTSKDFSVFAQLAPREPRPATPATTADAGDLDTTATATIPRAGAAAANGVAMRIIPSISLAAADADDATIVVEGIEEESQMETARELGCYLFQGYLIARPLEKQMATRFIQGRATLATLEEEVPALAHG